MKIHEKNFLRLITIRVTYNYACFLCACKSWSCEAATVIKLIARLFHVAIQGFKLQDERAVETAVHATKGRGLMLRALLLLYAFPRDFHSSVSIDSWNSIYSRGSWVFVTFYSGFKALQKASDPLSLGTLSGLSKSGLANVFESACLNCL
jgi:hypothetical protein